MKRTLQIRVELNPNDIVNACHKWTKTQNGRLWTLEGKRIFGVEISDDQMRTACIDHARTRLTDEETSRGYTAKVEFNPDKKDASVTVIFKPNGG